MLSQHFLCCFYDFAESVILCAVIRTGSDKKKAMGSPF